MRKILLIVTICLLVTMPVKVIKAEDVSENSFINCDKCVDVIQDSYENEKISIIEKIVFEIFLTHNPEKIPVKYRCNEHKLNPSDISSIIKYPEGYLGEEMVVKGSFMGWEGAPGPPPLTRSDWVISNGDDAIYVTGRFPMGLNPIEKEDIGVEISIKGILREINFDEHIVYYIEMLDQRNKLIPENL
ncbi:MAG: hypothetical protein ACLFPF_10375 [Halanaerobiales bacterium]